MQYQIYSLNDPRTNAKRYIGVSGNAERRFKQHLRKPVNSRAAEWLADLKALGLMPKMEILFTFCAKRKCEVNGIETMWIEKAVEEGADLLNFWHDTMRQSIYYAQGR